MIASGNGRGNAALAGSPLATVTAYPKRGRGAGTRAGYALCQTLHGARGGGGCNSCATGTRGRDPQQSGAASSAEGGHAAAPTEGRIPQSPIRTTEQGAGTYCYTPEARGTGAGAAQFEALTRYDTTMTPCMSEGDPWCR